MAECLSSACTFREEREGQGLFWKIAGKHVALSAKVCSQSKYKKMASGWWMGIGGGHALGRQMFTFGDKNRVPLTYT